MRNSKILFYPYQIYKYLIIYPLLGLSTAMAGSFAGISAIIINDKFAAIFGIIWAKFNAYITPMFVKVTGKENIEKNQSYVIISNHQSLFDIFVVYGWLPVDFRWVMKVELRKVPFLGYGCEKMGHVIVDRSNHAKAMASINAAKEKIKDGTSIIFFSEGTRSDDGKLQPFKKGGFRMALDMKLPILPISIVGTKNIVPNNTSGLFPGFVDLVIHKPIEINNYDEKNMEDLINETTKSIQKGLDDYS